MSLPLLFYLTSALHTWYRQFPFIDQLFSDSLKLGWRWTEETSNQSHSCGCCNIPIITIVDSGAWQPAPKYNTAVSRGCHLPPSLLTSNKQNQWESQHKIVSGEHGTLWLCEICLTMATETARTPVWSRQSNMTMCFTTRSTCNYFKSIHQLL